MAKRSRTERKPGCASSQQRRSMTASAGANRARPYTSRPGSAGDRRLPVLCGPAWLRVRADVALQSRLAPTFRLVRHRSFSIPDSLLYIMLGTRADGSTDIHVMRRETLAAPFILPDQQRGGTALLPSHERARFHLIASRRRHHRGTGSSSRRSPHRWKISMHLSSTTAAVLAASVLLTRQSLWLLAFARSDLGPDQEDSPTAFSGEWPRFIVSAIW